MASCKVISINLDDAPPPKLGLLEYAKKLDFDKVKECLDVDGVDPNTKSRDGWTGLHAACVQDSLELLNIFLERNADITLSDNGGFTPIHYAALFGSMECCQKLLDHGADLEAKTVDTTFYLSKIPIHCGGGRTPLMVAVEKREAEMVQYLLSRGASTKIQDNDGRSAYDLACRDPRLRIAAILKPEQKDHVYVNEPINIPHKIALRVLFADKQKFTEYKKKLLEQYKPKHMDVYNITQDFFEDSFLNAVSIGTEESLRSILTEIHPGIFKFQMFKSEFCDKLLEELQHFETTCTEDLKITVRRPNSMNNYGVILDDLGFFDTIQQMMLSYVSPFAKILYPNYFGNSLDNHHCFLVRYKMEEDLDLALHVDDSEVTLNVCLGKEFTGGTLNFYGIKGNPTYPDSKFVVEHKKGVALLHVGAHWHEANKIESGERCNLILWCRASQAKTRSERPSNV